MRSPAWPNGVCPRSCASADRFQPSSSFRPSGASDRGARFARLPSVWVSRVRVIVALVIYKDLGFCIRGGETRLSELSDRDIAPERRCESDARGSGQRGRPAAVFATPIRIWRQRARLRYSPSSLASSVTSSPFFFFFPPPISAIAMLPTSSRSVRSGHVWSSVNSI